jgi:DMSO/TMAO reductase YedYZ molybdopterin-dependent catalytic subunit
VRHSLKKQSEDTMKHRRSEFSLSWIALVGILLALALAGCGGGAPQVDWELAVSGDVASPLTLSYSELADLPQTELEDILMEKSLGEDTIGSWSGVSLQEILDKAGAASGFASVTAVAADGYAIEVSSEELQDGIVALKENEEWITKADPDHGPIRLVTPHTPANRWVFQIVEIQVNESAQGSGAIPENAALKVTGMVDTEVGWTADKLEAMDMMDTDYTDKDGETTTYAGVPLNDLIAKASPAANATTVVMVADDGYSAELALAEVQTCQECIVSGSEGQLRVVMPGFPGNVQVKGIVEIQIK